MDGTLFSINMSLLLSLSGFRYAVCGKRILTLSNKPYFPNASCRSTRRLLAPSQNRPVPKSPRRKVTHSFHTLCPPPSALRPRRPTSARCRATQKILSAILLHSAVLLQNGFHPQRRGACSGPPLIALP